MNPIETWQRLLTACLRGDMDEAAECATNLSRWMKQGGFIPPELPERLRRPGGSRFLRHFAMICRIVEEEENAPVPCPHCEGTGHVEATQVCPPNDGPCGECRGTGVKR
jgi:hypothetical protein